MNGNLLSKVGLVTTGAVLALSDNSSNSGDSSTRSTPVETTVQTPASANAEPIQSYVLNTNTLKFHKPTCKSVNDMKESNKWYFDGTRSEVIAMGYSPCGNCHP